MILPHNRFTGKSIFFLKVVTRMKRMNWQFLLGLLLVCLSALFYLLHYFIFKDAHHIFLYLIGDIAFIPIDVLIVTLIIHKLLSNREKRLMLKKLNMVIGAFFSEVGTNLLHSLLPLNHGNEDIAGKLQITAQWSEKEYTAAMNHIKKTGFNISIKTDTLTDVKELLIGKRGFLLGLIENPNLLEHESFSDMLWAVFHLTEELEYRRDILSLGGPDAEHIAGDIKRAFSLLIVEWVLYMKHLKNSYPFLFSLSVRTNPFNPCATVEIKN